MHAFAARLRQVRLAAGNPTYGALARRTGRSSSALAAAASGAVLPTWETVDAYVTACDGNPVDFVADWEKLRELRELPTLGRALLADAPAGLTNLRRSPAALFVGR